MRYLTISWAIVAVMVLSACGTEGMTEDGSSPTVAPEQEAAPGQEPAEETPAGEEEAAGGDATPEEMPNVLRGADLAGYDVVNTGGESLGNTEDLMVTLEGGQVDYLVLNFGGFLGLGENNFLIPWQAVTVSPEEDAYVTDALTEETLSEAPTFSADAWPDTTQPDWDAEVMSYWQNLGITIDDEPAASESVTETEGMTETEGITETEEMTETEDVTETEGMTETEGVTETEGMTETEPATDTGAMTESAESEDISVALPESVRMTRLLDYTVRNPDGEELGALQDLMINWREGRVAYAVLSFGGFLGMGDKWFAVPLNALTLDPVEQVIVIDVDEEMLSVAPGFDKDDWPETANPNWDEEIRQYWEEWMQELEQQQIPATGEGVGPGAEATPVAP